MLDTGAQFVIWSVLRSVCMIFPGNFPPSGNFLPRIPTNKLSVKKKEFQKINLNSLSSRSESPRHLSFA